MFKSWIELGLKKGFSDVEVYSTRNKSLSIELYEGKVESFTNSDVTTARIKGIYDGKMVAASVENLSTEAVDKIFDRLILNAKAVTVKEPAIIFEGSKSYPHVEENKFDFDSVPVEKKIAYLQALEKEVKKNKLVKQVEVSQYSESFGETTIVNSKGLNLTKRHNFAYALAYAIFEQDGDIKTGYDIKIIKSFDELDPVKEAEATIQEGLRKLGGKSLKTAQYDVVFSSKRFSDMLSVYSGLFSGEAAYRKTTALKDKKGEMIASPNVTIWDNSLHELSPFKNSFDDEGVAANPKKVVDAGRFTGFLHSLRTAALFNEEPTGNAFGGGIAPAGLYLEPGELSFDEVLDPIADGFYVTELVGLHAGVNTTSGDFSLQAGGVAIKDGKLDHAVKMVVLSGNWFELLNNVERIGSDLQFQTSGYGSPTVYVGKLTVSGEEK